MTNDARTPDEIERDIAHQRAQMSGSINDLQKKFSVDAIVSDVGAMLRDQGGDLGRAISQTVGRNPAAVALVGVGLAWLLVGQARGDRSESTAQRRDFNSGPRGARAADQWDRRAVPKNRPEDGPFHDGDRYWFGDNTRGTQDRQYRRTESEVPGGENDGQGGTSGGISGAIKSGSGAVADAVSGAVSSLRDTAEQMADRLSHGTEGFSDEAKARVLSARHAAHDARMSAEAAMNRSGKAAANFFEDQPLVVGALAVALGAAIAGALPRSKIEDNALGESSDRLFAEAQTVFHEERDKAMAVLKAAEKDAKSELKNAGSDLADLLPEGKSAADVIVEHVAGSASRVVEGARAEAEHQDLGQRTT